MAIGPMIVPDLIGSSPQAPAAEAVEGSAQSRPTGSSVKSATGPRFKACKLSMVREGKTLLERFQVVKACGYDGVELDSPNPFDSKEVLAAKRATGLVIHGTIDSVHWRKTLSDPKSEVRAQGLAALETALRDAKTYGGSTALLVPGVVRKNVSYEDVYKRSQVEIRKALPLAKELDVRIAIENVWNGFLLSPLEFRRYLDEFESPWIGAYLDIGNMRKFGWPEHWIEILGKRILKIDIKGYSLKKRFGVGILEGDVNWKDAVTALKKVGYSGWITAEVGGGKKNRLAAIAKDLDTILAM
jgi:L-ribulose-5-phosphate 3-epimerase